MISFKVAVPEGVKEFIASRRNRIYLILCAGLLFAIFYFVFAVYPRFPELAESSEEINKLNFQINLVNNRVRQLDEMMKQLNGLKEDFARYSKALPREKEIPEFLENLSQIAKKSGVKILSITPSEVKVAKADGSQYYREMPITITAKSGYHELGEFISSLENGERYVTIEDLGIKGDNKFPMNHNINIVLKTYVLSVEDEKQ